MTNDRLVLIDGNAILHRAYHAIPSLITSKGKLVNAVFGFCSMLLRIVKDLGPTHLAVCFDRPKPTFRKKMFANYQAKRPKMAEDLIPQVDLVHKVLAVMEIPVFEVDGFEADDVIGTLAKQAANTQHSTLNTQKLETIIVSGDRDLLQLVSPEVKVLTPVKGLSEAKLYDEAAVFEKWGVTPSQIPDLKALMGDPSDNYPGVSGIGPKTAGELVKRFKTLEKLYEEMEKLENKTVKEKLQKEEKEAILAKQLATIITDAPVNLDLEKCRLPNLDREEVRRMMEKLEFKSLIPRLNRITDSKREPQTLPAGSPRCEAGRQEAQLSLL